MATQSCHRSEKARTRAEGTLSRTKPDISVPTYSVCFCVDSYPSVRAHRSSPPVAKCVQRPFDSWQGGSFARSRLLNDGLPVCGTHKKQPVNKIILEGIVLNCLHHLPVAKLIRLVPEIVNLAQPGDADPVKCI